MLNVNCNKEIKAARGNIPYWAISSKLGIAESTLYRWLRFELSKERRQQVLDAIKSLEEELTRNV